MNFQGDPKLKFYELVFCPLFFNYCNTNFINSSPFCLLNSYIHLPSWCKALAKVGLSPVDLSHISLLSSCPSSFPHPSTHPFLLPLTNSYLIFLGLPPELSLLPLTSHSFLEKLVSSILFI